MELQGLTRTELARLAPSWCSGVRWVVFTDMDATLIGGEDFSLGQNAKVINTLAQADILVVLVTSKTAQEVVHFNHKHGLRVPAIVENGCAWLDVGCDKPVGLTHALSTAEIWQRLPGDIQAQALDQLPQRQTSILGLKGAALDRAMQREFSVPVLPQVAGDPRLGALGLQAEVGGRIANLVGLGCSKQSAITQLRTRLKYDYCMALGDGPNDRGMLSAADLSVCVSNPSTRSSMQSVPVHFRTQRSAPQGWLDAVSFVFSPLLEAYRHV